jgi:hypothetical protein
MLINAIKLVVVFLDHLNIGSAILFHQDLGSLAGLLTTEVWQKFRIF